MARVLITGMSGAGKSTLLHVLAQRGHLTVDTDYDGWTLADGRWDATRMSDLLGREPDVVVAGTVDNQGDFYDRFDHVVLLSAPLGILIERVSSRTTNPYGQTADEQAEIARYVQSVEPLLRKTATIELDGRASVNELADAVEELIEQHAQGEGASARVSEDEKNRLIAWNQELAAVHQRLRQALRITRDALGAGDVESAGADLLLYCHGFCAALSGHHSSEDAALFPELSARHPRLRSTIAKLAQDHEMIATLLTQFDHALTAPATPEELVRHLDGLGAIMESHFNYEERQLLDTLSTLHLEVDPHTLLGPL